jgi:YVTN family beta-propeller protein
MPHLRTRRAFLGATALSATACFQRSKPGFVGYAYVANQQGRAIAAVDLTAFAVVKHIPLDAEPAQLVNHVSRQTVYALAPEAGAIYEISSTALRRTRWNSLGGHAVDMRLGRGGQSLWVLMRWPKQLVEVPLDSFEASRRIPLQAEPRDFDLSPAEPLAVVTFAGVSVSAAVFLETGESRAIDTGPPVSMARFRKDGRQWIAAHSEKKLLSIFDTASGRVVVRLPLAMRPDNLCFNADGGQLFVTGQGMDAVAIVFPYSTEVAETVLAGNAPGPMTASPDIAGEPEYLFVTNPRSGQVTIMNIGTRRVVATAQVGAEPSHVVITPDNQFALVLNRASGDMAVLRIQSAARRTRFPAALFTMIPVGSRPVSAVVQAV